MEIIIDIFWYTIEPINNGKNGINKLVFVSRHEVNELVKGNQYDNLKLMLNQEIAELDTTSQIKNNSHMKKVSEFQVKIIRVYSKSAKIIDYESYYLDNDKVTTSGYKYTIEVQDLQINESYEVDGVNYSNNKK